MAEGGVDPIPVPKNARAALADKYFCEKWCLAMEAEVKGKYVTNQAWEYVTKIPPGRKVMKEGK